jgi:hypothetical protein
VPPCKLLCDNDLRDLPLRHTHAECTIFCVSPISAYGIMHAAFLSASPQPIHDMHLRRMDMHDGSPPRTSWDTYAPDP